jgi:mannose/fructose/N-acetylgalactosamine-specific phosphotransferase system component IIB
MENAITQFTYLPSSKAEREVFVQMCVDEITSGTRNPLEFEIMLKNLEETISAIRKRPEVKEIVLEEAEKYPEKTISFKGVKITKASKTTFYFNECGDSVYNELATQLSNLKEKVKERETFLKTIKPGMEIPDVNTGEIIRPPQTATTSYLTISLP